MLRGTPRGRPTRLALRTAFDRIPRGLAGHAFFETFSVLTRLPSPLRRRPSEIVRLLRTNFPQTRFLGTDHTSDLADRLGELGIAGGSVHDALVGAVAARHGLPLATRDRRALDVYRVLDVDYRIIEEHTAEPGDSPGE